MPVKTYRQQIEQMDDRALHMWLCHNGNPAECKDGCDAKANPARLDFLLSGQPESLPVVDRADNPE